MPNISGGFVGGSGSSGAFTESRSNNTLSAGQFYFYNISFNASRSSNKYKNSHDEVTPDNVAVRYYYKAF